MFLGYRHYDYRKCPTSFINYHSGTESRHRIHSALYKRDCHQESKSAQRLILPKLLVLLVNIYTKDVNSDLIIFHLISDCGQILTLSDYPPLSQSFPLRMHCTYPLALVSRIKLGEQKCLYITLHRRKWKHFVQTGNVLTQKTWSCFGCIFFSVYPCLFWYPGKTLKLHLYNNRSYYKSGNCYHEF